METLLVEDQIRNQERVDKFKQYIEGKDPFSIAGADIGLPIINKKFLNLIVYGQWATIVDNDSTEYDPIKQEGWGIAIPGVGLGIGLAMVGEMPASEIGTGPRPQPARVLPMMVKSRSSAMAAAPGLCLGRDDAGWVR